MEIGVNPVEWLIYAASLQLLLTRGSWRYFADSAEAALSVVAEVEDAASDGPWRRTGHIRRSRPERRYHDRRDNGERRGACDCVHGHDPKCKAPGVI